MGRNSWKAKDPASMGISNLDMFALSGELLVVAADADANDDANYNNDAALIVCEDAKRRRSSPSFRIFRHSQRTKGLEGAELDDLQQISAAADLEEEQEEEEEAGGAAAIKAERRHSSKKGSSLRRSSSNSQRSTTVSMHEHLLDLEEFVRHVAENKHTKRKIRRCFSSPLHKM